MLLTKKYQKFMKVYVWWWLNMNKIGFGIKDEAFIRDQVPMTKEEVRVVTLAKLDLHEDDVVLDIGAGTGSMSIECARLLKTKVYALECNELAQDLIERNKAHFMTENLEIIRGKAPMDLPKAPVTKVIIGGSRGQMKEILKAIKAYPLKKVVINTITLENTYLALQALKDEGYDNLDVTQVQISKGHRIKDITLMKGQNPITIISGERP
jgi:cobalt-precorrin-6B (C15)-methyltransferase